MNKSTDHFFSLGGTLLLNSRSYVKRPADDELLGLALAGKFCYLLTARQMGKSSLMIRTAARLKKEGIKIAILDLPRFGFQSITVDQWYLGLIDQMQEHLHFTEDSVLWWEAHANLPPAQRFTNFLRQVILTTIKGKIVIFIDEIDLTLKLPFRDEFFAAIRALHNARATNPELKRVTFIFLGVASPTDLIEDSVRTPFNVASRIMLGDLSLDDAHILQDQLEIIFPSQGSQIFEHIYRWTNGHPYLTQKLCLTVVQEPNRHWYDQRIIDGKVKELFQKNRFGRDDNIQWVEDFILQHEQRDNLLSLYKKVRAGEKIRDDQRSNIHKQLKLSGLVKVKDGHLELRNKIYTQVFNLKWLEEHSQIIPDPATASLSSLALVNQSFSWKLLAPAILGICFLCFMVYNSALSPLTALLQSPTPTSDFLPVTSPTIPFVPVSSTVTVESPIVAVSNTSTATISPTHIATAATASQTATPTAMLTKTGTPTATAMEPTTEPSPPVEPTTEPSPPVEPTTEPSPPFEPTTEPSPPVEPTTEPSPPVEPTTEPSPTVEPTTIREPTSEPTTVREPTSTPTTEPSLTVEPTTEPLPISTPTTVREPTSTPTEILLSPTNTSTPVPTNTPPLPTETPSPAIIPTVTPEPTQTITRATVAMPQLQAPEDGAAFSQPTLLQWSWNGTLQEDEYFDVRVWREGEPPWGIAWTKDTSFKFDPSRYGGGNYFWTIVVIRGQDGKMLEELSVAAPPRSFTITGGPPPPPPCEPDCTVTPPPQ